MLARHLLVVALFLSLFVAAAPPASAADRKSPHETTSTVVDGARVVLVYGRPYTKDPKTAEPRKIWGTLVPWDKVWRTGADEATLLVLQQPIQVGDTVVPAGAYTLFTLPSASGDSQLIINKQVGQWGLQYDPKQDLVRVPMKKEALDQPVDQFTMAVVKTPGGGGAITMSWENTKFSVPFTIKKTPTPSAG